MGLAHRHLSHNASAVRFDPAELGRRLEAACPEIVLAFLLGSARDGTVEAGSDLDLAVLIGETPTLELYARLEESVAEMVPDVHCDIGVLNHAEPIYRFEALKGRLLVERDTEAYVSFYSLTCRLYEEQLADYERQRRYRTGAA